MSHGTHTSPSQPINLLSLVLSQLCDPSSQAFALCFGISTPLQAPWLSHLGEEAHIPSCYALTKLVSTYLHSEVIFFTSLSLHPSSYFSSCSIFDAYARHSSNQLISVSMMPGTMLSARLTAVNRRSLHSRSSSSSRDY